MDYNERFALTSAEKNRAIKKALGKVYGHKNVRVSGGRGTAYGWVHIDIDVPHDNLREMYRKISESARIIARRALKEIGAEFYTYTSDDGYDSENECVIIQIHQVK